jgi:hypothetical protein
VFTSEHLALKRRTSQKFQRHKKIQQTIITTAIGNVSASIFFQVPDVRAQLGRSPYVPKTRDAFFPRHPPAPGVEQEGRRKAILRMVAARMARADSGKAAGEHFAQTAVGQRARRSLICGLKWRTHPPPLPIGITSQSGVTPPLPPAYPCQRLTARRRVSVSSVIFELC